MRTGQEVKMVSSAIRCLAIVGLVCALHGATAETTEHVNSWGDLSAQVIVGSTKSKIGIPFLQRSLELSYPEVSFNLIQIRADRRNHKNCFSSSIGL